MNPWYHWAKVLRISPGSAPISWALPLRANCSPEGARLNYEDWRIQLKPWRIWWTTWGMLNDLTWFFFCLPHGKRKHITHPISGKLWTLAPEGNGIGMGMVYSCYIHVTCMYEYVVDNMQPINLHSSKGILVIFNHASWSVWISVDSIIHREQLLQCQSVQCYGHMSQSQVVQSMTIHDYTLW